MDRRTLLKLLLSSALAEAVDVEQLLWVPKPIITVPGLSTVAQINQATFLFWRNQAQMANLMLSNPSRLLVALIDTHNARTSTAL